MFSKFRRSLVSAVIASFATAWLLGIVENWVDTNRNPINLNTMYALLFLRFAIAFSLGGAIAGQRFIVPASVSVLVVIGAIVAHTAYLAARVSLPVLPVLFNNLPIIVLSTVGALAGAMLGARLHGTSKSRPGDAQ